MPSFSGEHNWLQEASPIGNRKFIAPVRTGPPRLDPYLRLLCRFYEPLFLLAALGQTRGEHTAKPPDLSPEQTYRRRFLRNLAYICDFKKGGESCTAIGLEDSETCYRFWVACNNADDKFTAFLVTVLSELKVFSGHNFQNLETAKTTFVKFCLDFASPRIKAEILSLLRAIRECYSATADPQSYRWRRLQCWENSAPHHGSHFDFCCYVYNNRKSDFITMLSLQAKQEERLRGPEAKRSSFASVNHYIGRLANHIEAPQQLVEDAGYLGQILESYQVHCVEKLQSIPPLLPNTHTTMPGILNRMLKKGDPERPEIENGLLYRNNQSGLFQHFLEQYKKGSPLVHAEVQVLEYFYRMNLSFIANDRYVACSKPACLCCQMYFKYHPARMVIPESHCKVWINWGPPLVTNFSKNDPDSKQQKDILNQIVGEIRRNVVSDILGHSPAHKWHPDSRTFISGNQCFDSTLENPWSPIAGTSSAHWESKNNPTVASDATNIPVERLDEDYQSEDGGIRIMN